LDCHDERGDGEFGTHVLAHGPRAESRASAENGAKWYAGSGKLLSGRWTQDDAVQWLTRSDKAPQRNDQASKTLLSAQVRGAAACAWDFSARSASRGLQRMSAYLSHSGH
jgi:hypothetical protein